MDEKLKTSFVAELVEDSTITSVFLVCRKDVRQKKDGENYLALTLGDRTGQIDAMMWDRVAEVQNQFERDDFVRVRGVVKQYREKPQLTIDKLRRVEEREILLGDYLPTTTADVPAMFAELRGRIAAFTNPDLKRLLTSIFDDASIAERYQKAPAAKGLHHAFLGGLLEHVTSLCRLAELVAQNYPYVDRDLLISGILLHDLGKIEELSYARSFAYTTSGQLLGHMVIVLEMLHRKIAALGAFPRPLQTLLEHLVISHHGKYEFGSPKLPMFPEALLLHQLDDMDSKMQAMHTQLEQEQPLDAEWTAYNRSMDRPLLRTGRYLAAAAGTGAGHEVPGK